jgi:hypothetical protein
MFEKVSVKFSGEYFEFSVSDLDVDPNNLNDSSLKQAVAVKIRDVYSDRGQSIALPNLNGFVVDPPEDERLQGMHNDKTVLNLRPSAVLG